MNDRQNNKYTMYRGVIETCSNHKEIWQSIPAFAKSFNEFQSVFNEIHEESLIQSENITGHAMAKKRTKYALADEVYKVMCGLTAYASMMKEYDLNSVVSYNLWTLQRVHDTELSPICRIVLNAATEVIDALADYGTTKDDLKVLQEKILDYEHQMGAPRNAIIRKSAATSMLKELFKKADSILKNQMDRLMEVLKNDHSEFYSKYFISRRIWDRGVRHRKEV